MKRGILMISLGDKFYAEVASNLASSVKIKNPNVKIAIITDGNINSIPKQNRDLFDKVIKAKSSNPFEVKTQICDLTPFSKTLYLDADSLFISDDVDRLFEQFDDNELVIHESARLSKGQTHDELVWLSSDEIWKGAKLKKDSVYPVYNTSLIYFKKTAETKKYFTAVKKAYKSEIKGAKTIGGFYPDELAFGIASAKTEFFSGLVCFENMYHNWSPKMNRTEILNYYDFLSMAGKSFGPSMLKMYNDAGANYCRKMGVIFTKFNKNKKVFQ